MTDTDCVHWHIAQDAAKRKQLDAAIEDVGLRRAAVEAAEDAERARQWCAAVLDTTRWSHRHGSIGSLQRC